MFRISCFADEISPDLHEQIALLRELGIHYVELRSMWNKNVLDLTDEEAETIRAAFAENGIRVSAIGSPIGKVDIDCELEPYLDKMERAIELAHRFGTKYIRIFSFYLKGHTLDESREKVMRRLSILLGMARRAGVVLCMENEAGIYGQKSERCQDVYETMNDPAFRGVIDPSNYVIAGERPFESLKRVHRWIEYVHVKDNRGGRETVPAGEGDGQMAEVLDFLRYHDGMFVSLEPHLAKAGALRGFSGVDMFRVAHRALTGLLDRLGIAYE